MFQYYNTVDGRRQWEFPAPEEEMEAAVDPRVAEARQQQDRWYTAHDHAGRIYYVDSYTGTTTYEPPPHLQPGYQVSQSCFATRLFTPHHGLLDDRHLVACRMGVLPQQ